MSTLEKDVLTSFGDVHRCLQMLPQFDQASITYVRYEVNEGRV